MFYRINLLSIKKSTQCIANHLPIFLSNFLFQQQTPLPTFYQKRFKNAIPVRLQWTSALINCGRKWEVS